MSEIFEKLESTFVLFWFAVLISLRLLKKIEWLWTNLIADFFLWFCRASYTETTCLCCVTAECLCKSDFFDSFSKWRWFSAPEHGTSEIFLPAKTNPSKIQPLMTYFESMSSFSIALQFRTFFLKCPGRGVWFNFLPDWTIQRRFRSFLLLCKFLGKRPMFQGYGQKRANQPCQLWTRQTDWPSS